MPLQYSLHELAGQVCIFMPLQYSLRVAAGQGDWNTVKALVERGANVNAKDDNGVCIRKIS